MRHWRFALIVAALVVALGVRADAQTTRMRFTSSGDVAACATDADQPVCFLRALANFPTHSPYSIDYRFGRAKPVLEALGEQDYAASRYMAAHAPVATLLYGLLDLQHAVAAEAITEDRNGAAPGKALEVVQLYGAYYDRLQPGGGAAARCLAYMEIWEDYGRDWQRAARPNLPRPSVGLTRAAISACEREHVPAQNMEPERLAWAYAEVGDMNGVRRVLQHDSRRDWARLQTALLTNDLDAAVREAQRPVRLTSETDRLRRGGQLAVLFQQLVTAHRVDLLQPFAVHILQEALRDQHTRGKLVMDAMRVVAERDTALARRFTERFDAAARDTSLLLSLQNAELASQGWVSLHQPEHIRPLVDIWAPTVAREEHGCGNDRPVFCTSYSVRDMLWQMGEFEEAWRLAPRAHDPFVIQQQMDMGLGIAHIDVELAHAGSPSGADEMLFWCADNAVAPGKLEDGSACALRLLHRAAQTPQPVPDGTSSTRYRAGLAALDVAGAAARRGNYDLMQTMVAACVSAWRDAPVRALETRQREYLEDIAVFQLEHAGRL